MRNYLASVTLVLCLPALLAGCAGNSPVTPEAQEPLAWIEKGIVHKGVEITLGHRGKSAGAERWVEPVVSITHEGEPVANAMVFNSLVSTDGSKVIGDEVATVYEPPSGKEPALYAQGKLKPPTGSWPCVVRFRIVLPDIEEQWTRDIEIPLR